MSAGLLPGGYWDGDGRLHREFELSPLTGWEEELLVQRRGTASLVTQVLSRCVHRLGTISPVPEEVTRGLLVADRHHLLLRLRRQTFGDTVRADLICPWPDCGERVSIGFSIDDLPVEPAVEPAPAYTMTLSEQAAGGHSREITFRLPTGGDQEALSHELGENEAVALTRLLERCVEGEVSTLSPLARAEIEERMAQVAPRVEQTLEVGCVECGRLIVAPLDVHRFFFGDLRTDAALLYQEVHYLAFHYHWSERDIMAMTRDRRRMYIDVLSRTLEELNDE